MKTQLQRRAGATAPAAIASWAALPAAAVALLAACAPLPVDVPIGAGPADRPKIVGVARAGVLHQIAVVDASQPDPALLPTVPDARDDETIEVVVMTLSASLDTLGLTPGLYEDSAVPAEGLLANYAARAVAVERATVVAGALSSFAAAALPGWMATFRVPVAQACSNLEGTYLADLPAPATFVVRLADGRALVGTRANAATDGLVLLDPSDPRLRVAVRLEQPAEVASALFYAMGALPVADAPDRVWLSMRFGEVWRISLAAGPGPIAPELRVPTGMDSGVGFVHGRARGDDVLFYGLAPAGALVRFDGLRADELHDFGDAPYFGGGIAEDADGTVFAVRTASGDAIGVVNGAVRTFPADGSREGLTAAAFVPGVGLVISDGRGVIYQRQGDRFAPLVDLGIGTGAQALVATRSGFLGGGGAGAVREWRARAGVCPPTSPLVGQTLRYWAPFGDGWLVSGPERDGATGAETALTVLTP